MTKRFDPLEAFVNWFMRQPFEIVRPIGTPRFYQDPRGSLIASVLYRDGSFQVESFMVLPKDGGSLLPEHTHPDVDSFEIYLSGELYFTVGGKRVATDEETKRLHPDGASVLVGQAIRVLPNDPHGARVGEKGGSFLSIQRWLHGVEPSSVGLNWAGEEHAAESKAALMPGGMRELP